jgi:hypothetical protein
MRGLNRLQAAFQKQSHNRQASGGSMPGMPQQSAMQGMQNNAIRGQQFSGQVGITSPTNQPSIVQQQHQQQQQQHQSPQNGTFPFPQNQMNSGTNVPNPQMMGSMNINNLTHQQRQLLMMQHQQQQNQQQQQQMRTGGGGNPVMMSAEAYTMAQERSRQEQHQRLSQANSPTNAGSPSSFSNDTNSFPVLRSNSTIPGIARSTRSPSDGAPSPMSPQLPRGVAQDMRRMVNPSMGGGMGTMAGFSPQMPNWQQKNQLGQQQQQSMPMGHLQPQNYGMQSGMGSGNSFGGLVSNQNWGSNPYPMAPSPTSGGYQQLDQMMIPRQSSSTPAPQMQPQSISPPIHHTSPNEFEMFNWEGGL